MRRQHNRDNLTTKIKGGQKATKKGGSAGGGFKGFTKSTAYPVTPKK